MSYAEVHGLRGKIAGLGFFGSLGDAQADYQSALAAYQVAHAQWVADKATYDALVAQVTAHNQSLQAQYGAAMAAYSAGMAQWNTALAQHQAALVAMNQQQLKNTTMKATANNAAKAAGASYSSDYPGCVTQAQHNAWAQTCSAMTSVKGLGVTYSGSECALALLPVCPPAVAVPAAMPPQPTAPAAPTYASLPPALRPEPQPPAPPPASTVAPAPSPAPAPVLVTTPSPSSIPVTTSAPAPVTPSSTTSTAGLLKTGLLVVVLAGGGYALYRTFKKPKAA